MNEDIRDAFFDQLLKHMYQDRRIVILTVDHTAFGLEKIKQELPRQVFNVGVAEQQAVSMAAGMALGGYRPFVYGIAVFLLGRAYEQLRVDVSMMELPVVIVGTGGGYTYGTDGPTHHAPHDLELVNTLPRFGFWNAFNADQTRIAVDDLVKITVPVYFALVKGASFPGRAVVHWSEAEDYRWREG